MALECVDDLHKSDVSGLSNNWTGTNEIYHIEKMNL
jgi:hypothetical protein